jgi:hypothetical protein
LIEVIDQKRIEHALNFCERMHALGITQILGYFFFVSLFFRACRDVSAIADINYGGRLLVNLASSLIIEYSAKNPEVVTKKGLRTVHTISLVMLFCQHVFTSTADLHWFRPVYYSLRALVGLMLCEFRFSVISNILFSIALLIVFFFRFETEWHLCWGSEVCLMLCLIVLFWTMERQCYEVAQRAIEATASIGAQWAMWNLLESKYDAVVQLGIDKRIHGALPRLRGLLEVHAETNTDESMLSKMNDPPVYSFMPIPISSGSKALEGQLLTDFAATGSDRETLDRCLDANTEICRPGGDQSPRSNKTQVVHMNLRSCNEQSIKVRVYHACFTDLWGESMCHLVGICEDDERSPLVSARSEAAKLPLHTTLCSVDGSTPASALCSLFFDTLDPGLAIKQVSDSWTSRFGQSGSSLFTWLGQSVALQFQEWLARLVHEALHGGWHAETAKHYFRTLSGRFPNGVRVKTMLSLTLFDPAEHHNPIEHSYVAMLSAEDAPACADKSRQETSHRSNSRRSLRSYRSSRSSGSVDRDWQQSLATVEEGELVKRSTSGRL